MAIKVCINDTIRLYCLVNRSGLVQRSVVSVNIEVEICSTPPKWATLQIKPPKKLQNSANGDLKCHQKIQSDLKTTSQSANRRCGLMATWSTTLHRGSIETISFFYDDCKVSCFLFYMIFQLFFLPGVPELPELLLPRDTGWNVFGSVLWSFILSKVTSS